MQPDNDIFDGLNGGNATTTCAIEGPPTPPPAHKLSPLARTPAAPTPDAKEVQSLIDGIELDADLLLWIKAAIERQPVAFWKNYAPWKAPGIAAKVRKSDGPEPLRSWVAKEIKLAMATAPEGD